MRVLQLNAPAKVNLRLRVLARRPDGYHELDSLMVPVALADRLRIERTAASAGVEVVCPGQPALDGPDNLAHRAASAWLRASRADFGVRIRIDKRIPIQAGLGGGSSDAASTLRALQALASQPLPDRHLHVLAKDLGADVPFFLQDRPCRARGIGERLEPLAGLPRFWLVLACAPFGLSTRLVFETLKYPLTSVPDGDNHYRPRGWDFRHLVEGLVNDLQPTAEHLQPAIGQVRKELLNAGAAGAMMSGSGPSVFGLFPSRKTAREASKRLHKSKGWAYLVVRAIN